MNKEEKNVELTTIRIVQSTNDVLLDCMFYFQNATLFQYEAEDLEAPSATKKDALFDWQFEDQGNKTIERFGGIENLMKTLGTNEKDVSYLS